MKGNGIKAFISIVILLMLAVNNLIAGGNGEGFQPKLISTYNLNIDDSLLGPQDYVQFNGLYFFSEIGLAVGYSGHTGIVWATKDGGKTWNENAQWMNRLNSIFFLDDETGLISGDLGTIALTTDGGSTWSDIDIDMRGNISFNDLYFENDYVGYAIAAMNYKLYKTEDAGLKWVEIKVKVNDFPGTKIIKGITISDGQNIWLIGVNLILLSVDNGNSWVNKTNGIKGSPNSKIFNRINFNETGQKGWILGNMGTILFTMDSGESWIAVVVENEPDLLFIDHKNSKLYGVKGKTIYVYETYF